VAGIGTQLLVTVAAQTQTTRVDTVTKDRIHIHNKELLMLLIED
jgi:hypothetical protein